MEKDLLIYTVLTGFHQTAKKLETDERLLFHMVKDKNNYNSEFFKRVIEIIKSCVDTMSLDIVSEYFHLSKELIQSLLDPSDSTFMNLCRGLIPEKYSDQVIQTEKVYESVDSSNAMNIVELKTASNPVNSIDSTNSDKNLNYVPINSANPSGSTSFNLLNPSNSSGLINVSNPVISIDAISPVNGITPISSIKAINPISSNNSISPITNTNPESPVDPINPKPLINSSNSNDAPNPQNRSQSTLVINNSTTNAPIFSITPGPLSNTAYNPLGQVRRTVNIANLLEHQPNRGTIINPDYSFTIDGNTKFQAK